ncbi:MAG: hypothetical protein AAFS10_26015 [Myxococcota bacterium]
MAKPWIHAKSTARRYGGKPEDYIEIHEFLDSSKSTISDHRHRALTHNTWFIYFVPERVFGRTIVNSAGREVSVRSICEQHVEEDFGGFIPTAQDWIQAMDYQKWMSNGRTHHPPSVERIERDKRIEQIVSFEDNDDNG